MTRSVYTLCVFQNLNPVGFCVVCAFCGELQAKEMLSEEWKVKSEKSNGLSEDTASNECWAKPNQTSCSLFAQSSLHPSLLFTCSLVLIFRSEKWRVKSEKSNGLSEDTARKECWAKPNQTSCSLFAQSSLHPSLLFTCSLVLIFRSEKWRVKSEKSNG